MFTPLGQKVYSQTAGSLENPHLWAPDPYQAFVYVPPLLETAPFSLASAFQALVTETQGRGGKVCAGPAQSITPKEENQIRKAMDLPLSWKGLHVYFGPVSQPSTFLSYTLFPQNQTTKWHPLWNPTGPKNQRMKSHLVRKCSHLE